MQNLIRQQRERAACLEHEGRTGDIHDCKRCILGYTLPDINWADETPLTICQVYEALDCFNIERLQYEVEKRQGKWGVIKTRKETGNVDDII